VILAAIVLSRREGGAGPGRSRAVSLNQPESFEVVFDRHFACVVRYLSRRVGDGLAKELAAETLERAFRGRGSSAASDGSALPWLYGIAGNLVRMHHRTEERRLRAYARAALLQPEGLAVELQTGAGPLAPILAEALAALSPPLREVLLLHAWGELSDEEIANALGLSLAAVRTRLHRARSQVARRLDVADDTEPLETESAR
jgi:RNA polymerase sigma-70 factor (ECF subfamily)